MKTLALLAALAAFGLPLQDVDEATEPATGVAFATSVGESQEMRLLGVAARTRWMFKIYAIGLYAEVDPLRELLGEGPVNDQRLSAAVIASRGQRALVLKFVRNLTAEQFQGAFSEGIERTIAINDERIAADAATFLDAITDIANGDVAVLWFGGEGEITLNVNDEEEARMQVTNRTLARAILSIYLGLDPVDERLKRNLMSMI